MVLGAGIRSDMEQYEIHKLALEKRACILAMGKKMGIQTATDELYSYRIAPFLLINPMCRRLKCLYSVHNLLLIRCYDICFAKAGLELTKETHTSTRICIHTRNRGV